MANINTNAISIDAFIALNHLDAGFIGTPDYMGIAYFWAMDYKHDLREASYSKRRKVHGAFLKAGLEVNGISKHHEEIVLRIC